FPTRPSGKFEAEFGFLELRPARVHAFGGAAWHEVCSSMTVGILAARGGTGAVSGRWPVTAKRRLIMANPIHPTQRERSGFNNPGTTAAETAQDVAGAARSAAAAVAEKAGEAASYLGNKAESATAAVGGGMRSLAGTTRENLPHEGVLG